MQVTWWACDRELLAATITLQVILQKLHITMWASQMALFTRLANVTETGSRGGVWGFIFNDNLLNHSFQKVPTNILIPLFGPRYSRDSQNGDPPIKIHRTLSKSSDHPYREGLPSPLLPLRTHFGAWDLRRPPFEKNVGTLLDFSTFVHAIQ